MNFHRLYDENSEILILGSFPSEKSREMQFFYGHPQNRFLEGAGQVLNWAVPQTIPEKKEMLAAASYRSDGTWSQAVISQDPSDSSHPQCVPNDLAYIMMKKPDHQNLCKRSEIKTAVMTNIWQKSWGYEAVQLPSTSPANAGLQLWSVCWNTGKK